MRIIDIICGPWAVTPAMLDEIQSIYAAHVRGPKINIPDVEARIGRPLKNEARGYQVVDGVAVLSVEGVIAKRMNLFTQISGGSSTDLVRRDLRDALADPAVSAIVLAIDSPGGTVDGTADLAEEIYRARGKKPVVAWTDGMMASAAYWIGSAADSVHISSPTATVGSIGVVAKHVDVSRMEEMQGIRTTEVVAGKYKRIASQYGPLSPEGRADMQDKVDRYYSVFVDTVARHRGVSAEQVVADMADGRIFIGSQAVAAGLVDGVSTLEELIASLKQSASAGVAARPKAKEKIMNLDELKAEHPDLVTAIIAEATAGAQENQAAAVAAALEEAKAEHQAAIDANTQRIDDILAVAGQHNCLDLARTHIKAGTTAEGFCKAVLNDLPAARPINTPDAGADTVGTMKRADFNKMDHADRSAYLRNGGKITD